MEDLFAAISGASRRHPNNCECPRCQEAEHEYNLHKAHHKVNAVKIKQYFNEINDPRSLNIKKGSWVVIKPGHANTAAQQRLEPVFVLEMFDEIRVMPSEEGGLSNMTFEPMNMRIAVGVFPADDSCARIPSIVPAHSRNYLLWIDVGGQLDEDGFPIVPAKFIPNFGYNY
jgi:hypothetical protein